MDTWHKMQLKLYSTCLFFLALDYSGFVMGGSEVENHLEMGRDFLARGQLQDALSHYHAAVEGDPDNYLTYFKRGTVYLALGKAKFALIDFGKVLELKPDFTAARYQRGVVLMKQASIEDARKELYNVYLANGDFSQEAHDLYSKLDGLAYDIQLVTYYEENKDFESAINSLDRLIEHCPWAPSLREQRSQLHINSGNLQHAIMDLRTATKLQADDTDGHYKLSKLYYSIGDVSESLKGIRECLKLDPDHKLCHTHYKLVKKIERLVVDSQSALNIKDFPSCIQFSKKALDLEKSTEHVRFLSLEKLCHCYQHTDEPAMSLKYCSDALDISKTADLYCMRAEAYIANSMFEEAIRDFEHALQINQEHRQASEGLKKAKQLQKQAERKDYYKILNVKRTATKQEIIKAYRKAAQQWHPDNFQGEAKKNAEKRFIEIASAKEVLTDPEKREQFDRGIDPLDPESGRHQQDGFNPFQQFHQFHGSPFTFKFNFN
ncbi:Hypothetical protein CINCED_3A002461 [Cinara cedri]|uniref:J domain-containing protein n=1 Tax=Cinara cedri TaxID=506608 RepID=A0A5E4NIC2_9HEMI|nr:Hypothetical protein CINCED_3A002461 [Cinara cedri]